MSTNRNTLNLDGEIKQIKDKFGCEEWLTTYFCKETPDILDTIFCALIPNNKVKETLGDPSWDFQIGDGLPDFVTSYHQGKKRLKYYRFSYKLIEPLLIWRTFYNVKEPYWEINEEFRHYFNLYEDRTNGKFYHIDGNGDENEVAVIEKNSIRIKLAYIKEFLAVRKMSLLIEYEFNRFSTKTLEEQGMQEFDNTVKEENYCYAHYIRNFDFIGDHKSHARLFGVKVIHGFSKSKPKELFEKDKKYEEYFVGFDKNGKEIYSTSDEKKLADFFGKNKGAFNYLTPVFFSKDVLSKYYSKPSKYSVGDGGISCASLWSLRIDNNHPDYVMVFLGDLGHLATKEQLYWKHYNIKTKGKISHTAWMRNFEAEWADPEKSDLFFKQRYQQVQKNWERKMGWDLFRPLSSEDEYHFKTLRIPLTNEQKEFDEQVLSLTRLIIDLLNEKELAKGIDSLPKDVKGITKFEAYLESRGYRFKEMFKFLRDLQELRSSGVAHSKGENYSRIKKAFDIGDEEKQLSDIFDGILVKAIWMLNTIDYQVLNTEK
jgi:hypothetical protein